MSTKQGTTRTSDSHQNLRGTEHILPPILQEKAIPTLSFRFQVSNMERISVAWKHLRCGNLLRLPKETSTDVNNKSVARGKKNYQETEMPPVYQKTGRVCFMPRYEKSEREVTITQRKIYCRYRKGLPGRSCGLKQRKAASDIPPHSRKWTVELSLTSLFCPLTSCQHLPLIKPREWESKGKSVPRSTEQGEQGRREDLEEVMKNI